MQKNISKRHKFFKSQFAFMMRFKYLGLKLGTGERVSCLKKFILSDLRIRNEDS